jgi:hypothetical protein
VWQNQLPIFGEGSFPVARNAICWALLFAAAHTISEQPARALQTAGAPPPGVCEMSLQAADQSWKGVCGPVFGNKEPATLTGRTVESLPGGAGRGDATPTLMLVAELPTQWGTWNLELEFYGKDGVIRTPAPWRPITLIGESREATLRFRIAEDTEVEPSDLDRRIVQRASEILATEGVWDRADDRKCAPEDKTWSIYCAFHRASVDVSGGFHHRRPCLQIARAILYERVAEERKKGRKYPHIMADYNNDPTTRFADVQSLFGDVATRMKR